MFNLATEPNVEVVMLGTGPCGLIAARPKGGNWASLIGPASLCIFGLAGPEGMAMAASQHQRKRWPRLD
jgi:hypothetical protein